MDSLLKIAAILSIALTINSFIFAIHNAKCVEKEVKEMNKLEKTLKETSDTQIVLAGIAVPYHVYDYYRKKQTKTLPVSKILGQIIESAYKEETEGNDFHD